MFAGDVVMLDIVMSPSTADLPCDPDDLRRVAGDLQRDVAALSAEIHAKTLLIEKLRVAAGAVWTFVRETRQGSRTTRTAHRRYRRNRRREGSASRNDEAGQIGGAVFVQAPQAA